MKTIPTVSNFPQDFFKTSLRLLQDRLALLYSTQLVFDKESPTRVLKYLERYKVSSILSWVISQ